jgi:EAL domain-containing protein (putative c-di-GMP-specific phosphodiesterase class I)
VNISATELSEPSLDERILAACVTAGVPANQLILEVTETSAMVDPVTSLQLLTRLRLEGFKVSIDDFGTGYSSMHQLARLPFSEIKIDQSFVKDIPDNPQSVSIARTIINLAHSLGMTVIAEGVENERALGALTELGCDLAQGYFISRPLYPDQIDSWLALQRQPAQQVNDAQQVDPASPLARLLNHDFYRGEDAADKAQQP